MKRCVRFLLILVFGLIAAGCKKENFNYPEGYVGSSRITFYPVFTMNGSKYMVLKVGDTFTDPGVTAKEETTDLTVTTSGTVNTSVQGVYTLTYSAVNKDGFPASITRVVVVANIAPDAAANDLSGKYARTSNGQISVWTRIAPGVYTVFNPGGAAGTNLTVVVLNDTGNHIYIPPQQASDGSPTSSSDESYNPATGTYSWVIVNPGYGTALRTFVKQ